MNGLAEARSGYLRGARFQPVEWMEWGPEAFARAVAEGKPVLLDIGAVWCHWCHVMDRESYEDAETARLINEHFVAVKVDRDERPDVDARYQAAVAAISGQGGWPLTAFLTPDGKPFFGGTYFPPVDQHGRPGLRRVLMTMAEAFEQRRGEVEETAGSVMEAVEQSETFDSGGKLGEALVEAMVSGVLGQFDTRFGGFGSQPKFPHSGAIDLLIDAAGRGNAEARRAALVTLDKMSRGGIYDHLAGGFHRYSVDERWVVPHFEKMLYDNAGLLLNYVHAFQSFGERACARVAREIMAWVNAEMSDRELGGFYGSQDADVTPDDDGDYWTWTRAEAAAVLTAEEMQVVGPWFDIGELGDMRHNVEKNCLHIDGPAPTAEAMGLIQSGRGKMLAARQKRPKPYVDRTIYVGWNGMMVSAYVQAGRVLGDAGALGFGLKTLDRLLGEAWNDGAMGHVVCYGEGGTGEVAGGLDDYAFVAQAALDAWEATGSLKYFEGALAIGEAMVERFYDEDKGGFFDAAGGGLGALSARRKPIQDSPTPAGNAVAATVLLQLADAGGRDDLRAKARATLECFAGVVEHLGLYAASLGLAVRRLSAEPVRVLVVGEGAEAEELVAAGLYRFGVGKTVVRVRAGEDMPAGMGEVPAVEGVFAVICRGFSCLPPVRTGEELVRLTSKLDGQT